MKKVMTLFICCWIASSLLARHDEAMQNINFAKAHWKKVELALAKNNNKLVDFHLKKADFHYKKAGNPWMQIALYSKLRSHYSAQKNYQKAIYYSQIGINQGYLWQSPPHYLISIHNEELGNLFFKIKDYKKARQAYEKTINIKTEVVGLFHEVGNLYHKIGECYRLMNKNTLAIKAYEKGANIYSTNYLNYGSSHIYWSLKEIHRQEKNKRKARKYLKLYNEIKVDSTYQTIIDTLQKKLSHAIGTRQINGLENIRIYAQQLEIYYTKSKRWDQLILLFRRVGMYHKEQDYYFMHQYLNKAKQIAKTHIGGHSIWSEDLYNYLGEYYEEFLGDYNSAVEATQKTLAFHEKNIGLKNVRVAQFYNNIGLRLQYSGHYDEGIKRHNHALKLRFSTGYEFWAIGQSYKNLGKCYEGKQDYNTAMFFYNKMEYHYIRSLGKKDYLLVGYQNMGRCYNKMAQYDSAKIVLQLALNLLQDRDKTHKSYYGQRIYRDLGDAYGGLGQTDLQVQAYQKALNISKKIYAQQNPDLAENHGRLANYFLQQKQYKRAIKFSQNAVNSCSPTAKVVLLESYELHGKILLAAHKAQKNQQYLREAYDMWQQAIHVIEYRQVELNRQLARMKLLKLYQPVFDHAIETAYILYEQTKNEKYALQAFVWAEKSKVINAKLGLDNTKFSRSTQHQSFLKQLKTAEKQQLHFEHLATQNNQTNQLNAWSDSLELYKNIVIQLKKELEINHPDYYQLIYNVRTKNVKSIQAFLLQQFQQNTAVIAYFSGKDWMYSFTITKNQFRVHRIAKNNALEQEINHLLKSIKLLNSSNFNLPAYGLYQKLLSQSLTYSKRYEAIDRLIIIPDGSLYLLPFEALITEKPTPKDINPKFVLSQYIVTYAYSATQLIKKHEHQHDKKASRLFAAYAPLKFKNSHCQYQDDLVDLSAFENQVTNISRSFPNSRQFIGAKATKARFDKSSPNYQMLFLFTHACMQSEAMPHLYLSDTTLSSLDLYDLDLKAELAILCACGTGVGVDEFGGGLMSMAHGFFEAGVPSVLASLWAVPTSTSIDLVEKFTAYIQEGYAKDIALQKAKQDFLNNGNQEQRHPYQWAGFIHIGKTNPIPYYQSLYWWKVIGLTLLFGSVVFFLIKKNKIILRKQQRFRT